MKILAFTDIHASFKALQNIEKLVKKEDPDILVDCGDISIFENDLDYLISRLAKLKKTCLILHGNHEGSKTFEEICKKYKNIKFLHKKMHRVGNYIFLGWGGGGFALKDKGFEKQAQEWKRKIKKNDIVVLMTHAPPYNTAADKLYGDKVGNKSIRNFIEKENPSIALCGHIHDNNGKSSSIKKTKVINPGPLGKIIVV